jgi:hypothetical protein
MLIEKRGFIACQAKIYQVMGQVIPLDGPDYERDRTHTDCVSTRNGDG